MSEARYEVLVAQFHQLCDLWHLPKQSAERREWLIRLMPPDLQAAIRQQDQNGKRWIPSREEFALACAKMKKARKMLFPEEEEAATAQVIATLYDD